MGTPQRQSSRARSAVDGSTRRPVVMSGVRGGIGQVVQVTVWAAWTHALDGVQYTTLLLLPCRPFPSVHGSRLGDWPPPSHLSVTVSRHTFTDPAPTHQRPARVATLRAAARRRFPSRCPALPRAPRVPMLPAETRALGSGEVAEPHRPSYIYKSSCSYEVLGVSHHVIRGCRMRYS